MIPLLLPLLGNVLDKIIPDAAARDKAKADLAKMEFDGELKEMETKMSAIFLISINEILDLIAISSNDVFPSE